LGQKLGQIAHLDHNNSNNDPDNLAFLCLPHHDEYDTRTSQSKGWTIEEVQCYRSRLYKELDTNVSPKGQRIGDLGTAEKPHLGTIEAEASVKLAPRPASVQVNEHSPSGVRDSAVSVSELQGFKGSPDMSPETGTLPSARAGGVGAAGADMSNQLEVNHPTSESSREACPPEAGADSDTSSYQPPTVFFYNRVAEGFPGKRDLYETRSVEEIAQRLTVVLRQPLVFPHYFPSLAIFGLRPGMLEIRKFRVLDSERVLVDYWELRPSKLVVYRPEGYWRYFIYLESEADSPTGLYGPVERPIDPYDEIRGSEEYAVFKGELITREEYDDSCIFRNGRSLSTEGAELRHRWLIRTGIVITSRFSPINRNEHDTYRCAIQRSILEGQQSLDELVELFDRLPRHPKDIDSLGSNPL
jgi:hypothetical protein